MDAYKHFSEARQGAISATEALVRDEPTLARAVLIQDLFGKISLVVWPTTVADIQSLKERIDAALRQAAGAIHWTGRIWFAGPDVTESDRIVYDAAWEEGTKLGENVRLDDRHRNRTAWFRRFRDPLWSTRGHVLGSPNGPPVVVFSSFKGGVGRTTALASFAIQRARAGERVVVIDFDLDAPGVGTLLAADEYGTTAPWGVVDYLLERPLGEVPFADYVHRCARERVTGDGGILVIPAGRMDGDYLTKLSRVDFEVYAPEQAHPLGLLLEQARAELDPAWILIDARAGLSPAAGLLMSGFAHLHVLFGTTSEQSYLGIERLVHHLGAERLRNDLQADCLVIQAMVPDNTITGGVAKESFNARIEQIFREHYLVPEDDDPADQLWSLRDMENSSAPHVPVPIPYRESVAFFKSIDQVADLLAQERPYQELNARIEGRFPEPSADIEDEG